MKIPKNLEEIHPPLADANRVANKVSARIMALKASTATIIERLHANHPEAGNVETNKARVLAGETPLPEVLPDHEQVNKNRSELSTLGNSMQISVGNVQREKGIASTKLGEAFASEHTAFVKEIASNLSTLHASHTAYVNFLDAFENTGASNTYLRPVWPNVGSPFDNSGAYHWTFKEMRENGHITMKDIPEAVR
jgi:hypothetical protein